MINKMVIAIFFICFIILKLYLICLIQIMSSLSYDLLDFLSDITIVLQSN